MSEFVQGTVAGPGGFAAGATVVAGVGAEGPEGPVVEAHPPLPDPPPVVDTTSPPPAVATSPSVVGRFAGVGGAGPAGQPAFAFASGRSSLEDLNRRSISSSSIALRSPLKEVEAALGRAVPSLDRLLRDMGSTLALHPCANNLLSQSPRSPKLQSIFR